MGGIFTLYIAVMALCLFITFGIAGKSVSETSGDAGFKQHGSVCHPNGGNIINRPKTLEPISKLNSGSKWRYCQRPRIPFRPHT